MAEKLFIFPMFNDVGSKDEESLKRNKMKGSSRRCIHIDDLPAKLDFMSCYVEIEENAWFVTTESKYNSPDMKLKDFESKIDVIADLLVELVKVVRKKCIGTDEFGILKAVREVTIGKSFPGCDEYLKKRFDNIVIGTEQAQSEVVLDNGYPHFKRFRLGMLQASDQRRWDARRRHSKRRCNYKYAKNEEKFYIKPCDHEGECTEKCLCRLKLNYCEKFCRCPPWCKNRFPGEKFAFCQLIFILMIFFL